MDTGGETLALFAAFDRVGLRFLPASGICPAAVSTGWDRPRTWPCNEGHVRCRHHEAQT